MDCIFCKILNGEIPSKKVYEDEFVYAFHDINPMAPVHVIVIPKLHIESANMVDETFVHSNQVVIDVGINVKEDGKLCGDVNFDRVMPIVKAITPVPGGVGTVTTAVLCKHVIEAAEKMEV